MAKSKLEMELRLQLDMAGHRDYFMEYKFHPDRKWRFDFCWPQEEVMLGVEVEGGVWTKGRHTRGSGFIADCEKYNAAEVMGYHVIRVCGDHVKNGMALHWIENYLRQKAKEI